MKKLLVSIFLLILTCNVLAQQKAPTKEQWVFFPYALGECGCKKMKIMIVATEIWRFADVSTQGAQSVETAMYLDMAEVLKKIEQEQQYFRNSYDNIRFTTKKIETLFGPFNQWNATTVSENQLVEKDFTAAAMDKIRNNLIEKYKKQGYMIYQINSIPKVYGPNRIQYSYWDNGSNRYLNYLWDPVYRLSPTLIPLYEPAIVKSLYKNCKPASK